MDTGDATGDLFFDLFEVMLYPLACPDGAATPGGGNTCVNPEASARARSVENSCAPSDPSPLLHDCLSNVKPRCGIPLYDGFFAR